MLVLEAGTGVLPTLAVRAGAASVHGAPNADARPPRVLLLALELSQCSLIRTALERSPALARVARLTLEANGVLGHCRVDALPRLQPLVEAGASLVVTGAAAALLAHARTG